MLAIAKGGFRSILRSPSAVVFSLGFPMVFILVFGFIGGGGGGPLFKLVLEKGSDTLNPIYAQLKQIPNFRFITGKTDAEVDNDMIKGRIVGRLRISKTGDSLTQYKVKVFTTTASGGDLSVLTPFLENMLNKIDKTMKGGRADYAVLEAPDVKKVREYKRIDFILPGQLGFSLLSAAVFGVAFLFFNLRQTLVLKRFFATPIRRTYIILGEGLARVSFQMLTAIIIVGVGHFAFGFTLVHGISTFLEIMVLSFIALIVFMGFGFIVSSVAKNDSTIPPFANLFTLPQFLLAGTFFSIDVFPSWLQPLCRILPLTHFNDAMRKIAFEGAHLYDCGKQLGILAIWGVVIYAVAIKVFKWE